MRCAIVDPNTNLVVNIIVADPSVDKAPDGYLMLGDLPSFVNIGTVWKDGAFVEPVAFRGAISPAPIKGMRTL